MVSDQEELAPKDPQAIIRIASRDSLPETMYEFAFVWRHAKFFAQRPYEADGYVGAAFQNGNGDYFEVRTYSDAPRGSCRVFASKESEKEKGDADFRSALLFLGATGMRNMNALQPYDSKEPYDVRRDDYDSLVAIETLFDLILREAGRALPGVVSKDEVQAIIEAEWSFPDGDLKPDAFGRKGEMAQWLSSYEMLFSSYPSGYKRRTISFDGARRITLREKGLDYLRERAFIA
jgi:hypothetical protein